MKDKLENFVERIPNFLEKSPSEKIDYFLYFCTIELAQECAYPTDINSCFNVLNLVPYSNISQYLSVNSLRKPKKPPKYIKTKKGYCLVRQKINLIKTEVDQNPFVVKTHQHLRSIATQITDPNENDFLNEAIRCFEVKACRAAIIMTWNLTIDHLFNYILQHKLGDFNIALSKNTDKRIKVTVIVSKDDFSDIPENKFIEFCRAARIISNDTRKILDVKLGIRNTCGHPSNISILESKVIEFIEDLVINVISKFEV